jgi:hypothetical protein
MKTYSLVYSERLKLVLSLASIVFFLTLVYAGVSAVFNFNKIPVWIPPSVFITVLIITVVLVMNRIVKIPAEVAMTEDALYIRLHKTNFLHRSVDTVISLNNISRFTQDINTQNDYKNYCSISLKDPAKTVFIFQSHSIDDKVMNEFLSTLKANIDRYNRLTPVDARIVKGSFYDANWASVLTYVLYAILIGEGIAYFSGYGFSWIKWLPFYAFTAAWLMAYHTNRRKTSFQIKRRMAIRRKAV